MSPDLLIVALLAGAANWAFRVLPTRMRSADLPPAGRMARCLAATGPAAIATLFVAAILPLLAGVPKDMAALALGTLAVVGVFIVRRSVVAATLGGAVVYGAAVAGLG